MTMVDDGPVTPPTEKPAPVLLSLDDLRRIVAEEVRAKITPVVIPVAVEPSLVSELWTRFKGVFTKVWNAVSGFKTLIAFGMTGTLSLLDAFSVIDLTPYIAMVMPDGAKITATQAVGLMSLLGVALRFITNTPAFKGWLGSDIGKIEGETV